MAVESAIHSFDDALADFCAEVPPKNARVANRIHQPLRLAADESHLGGTQGLSRRTSLSVRVRVSEPERLEVWS